MKHRKGRRGAAKKQRSNNCEKRLDLGNKGKNLGFSELRSREEGAPTSEEGTASYDWAGCCGSLEDLMLPGTPAPLLLQLGLVPLSAEPSREPADTEGCVQCPPGAVYRRVLKMSSQSWRTNSGPEETFLQIGIRVQRR